jgi:hypothetical protein
MASDDEIRNAFHEQFGAAVNDATSDPALLNAIRRRYDRERRFMMIGAPLGVAVLATGSVTAVVELGHGSGGTQTVYGAGGSSVTVLGHQLTFPDGWKVGKPFGLSAVSVPETGDTSAPTPASDVETVTARDQDTNQSVTLTVFRGDDGVTTAAPTDSPTPSSITASTSPNRNGFADGDVLTCTTVDRVGPTYQRSTATIGHGKVHKLTVRHGHAPAGTPLGTATRTTTTNSNTKSAGTAGSATCRALGIAGHGPHTTYSFTNGDKLVAYAHHMTKEDLQNLITNAVGH